MKHQTPNDTRLAHVTISGHENGQAQVWLDGQRVNGVIGYRIEQNAKNKRIPHLILEIQCQLDLDTGAIPVLPEPWSWFYEPKYENFCDIREITTESNHRLTQD